MLPLKQIVEISGITLAEVDSITLVGGGTRIPKIQALLKEYFGRELGQNLNTDEAAVFGAAFRAAIATKVTKVRYIRVNDITSDSFGIRYEEDKVQEPQPSGWLSIFYFLPLFDCSFRSWLYFISSETQKSGEREVVVFKHFSPVDVRKQVTVKRHSDFTFEVENQGGGRLAQVSVTGFQQAAYQEQKDKLPENEIPKIVIFMRLDNSSILQIDKGEAQFSFPVADDRSIWEKTTDFVSSLWPSGSSSDEEVEGEDSKMVDRLKRTVSVPLNIVIKPEGVKSMSENLKRQALEARDRLKRIEGSSKRKEDVLNAFEAYFYEMESAGDDSDFLTVTTEVERETLRTTLIATKEWLASEGQNSEYEDLELRLAELRATTDPIEARKQVNSSQFLHLTSPITFFLPFSFW